MFNTNEEVTTFDREIKTIEEVATTVEDFYSLIGVYRNFADIDDVPVICRDEEHSRITGINAVPLRNSTAKGIIYTRFGDFFYTLENMKKAHPNDVMIINTVDGDYFVTTVTVEIYTVDDEDAGPFGCRLCLG